MWLALTLSQRPVSPPDHAKPNPSLTISRPPYAHVLCICHVPSSHMLDTLARMERPSDGGSSTRNADHYRDHTDYAAICRQVSAHRRQASANCRIMSPSYFSHASADASQTVTHAPHRWAEKRELRAIIAAQAVVTSTASRQRRTHSAI